MKCPNCGNETEEKSPDCVKCGIIFAKYEEVKKRKELDAAGQYYPVKKKSNGLAIAGYSALVIFVLFFAVAFLIQPKQEPVKPSNAGVPIIQDKVALISEGNNVDINAYLVQGKITVFDFYADWCGPCVVLGPKLEDYVNKNEDVVLRKVNIVNWGSPVCVQYDIRSVPNVRVYDKNGRMSGAASHQLDEIIANIEKVR